MDLVMPNMGDGIVPPAGDPCYLILANWVVPGGPSGNMMLDQYAPRLHNRPSAFSPAHTSQVVNLVRETLAKNGVLGAQVVITFIHRYEVQPSPLIDMNGHQLN